MQAEKGVHRLVRLSPFDSAHRRHTAFARVDVAPLVDDDVDVEVDEADLRIDTYRASGAGGQHVNKTDSAVRITHLPTGLVVQCQNERSQSSNKMTALRVLKSRMLELELKRREEELAKQRGETQDNSFGSQIRSYVLHPYTMVNDHRTNLKDGNAQGRPRRGSGRVRPRVPAATRHRARPRPRRRSERVRCGGSLALRYAAAGPGARMLKREDDQTPSLRRRDPIDHGRGRGAGLERRRRRRRRSRPRRTGYDREAEERRRRRAEAPGARSPRRRASSTCRSPRARR